MIYYLSQQIFDWAHGTTWESRLSFLRLFRYITVRSAGAAITALALSWWLGPKIIRWLEGIEIRTVNMPTRPRWRGWRTCA